jgi:peptidoglycan/xylan/chitin deacetylase (PgdA/CDA1 family)
LERTVLTERPDYQAGVPSYSGAPDAASLRPASSAFHSRAGESNPDSQPRLRASVAPRPNGSTDSSRRSNQPVPTVVVYHHFSTARHELTDALDISTDPESFRRHVKYYAKNFDLIAPSDLLGGKLPRKPLLITFDDVYRSVLEIGGPILREADIQSIWFMNPDCLESETLPLDNLLTLAAAHYGSAGLLRLLALPDSASASVPALISDHLSTLNYAQIAMLRTAICAGLPETQTEVRRRSNLFITKDDLWRLPEYGIQIGNHSLTHSFFRSLSRAELQIEIQRSRELLEQLSGQPVTCLAIPYGNELDATEAVLTTARSSGHRAIFLVHGRSNASRPAPDVYFRICADRLRSEFLPISIGILPRLRTFRDWLR